MNYAFWNKMCAVVTAMIDEKIIQYDIDGNVEWYGKIQEKELAKMRNVNDNSDKNDFNSVKYQLSAVLNYWQLPTIEVCVSKMMNLQNARLFFLVNAVNDNATFV